MEATNKATIQNKPVLVMINGLGGCGKSTFIDLCKTYCIKEQPNWWVHEFSTVDRPKQVATFAGWKGGKSDADRVFLSDIKKALAKWDNSPVNYVFTEISQALDSVPTAECKTRKHIFFVNSREPLDIDYIVSKAQGMGCDTYVIKVQRDGILVNEVPELINDIQSMPCDIIITNNGDLNNLYESAGAFVDEIIRNY